MVFLALALTGTLAWRQLPVELLPRFDAPQIFVVAVLPGASPDAIEEDVIRRLEGEIGTLEGIKEISARAQEGQAVITVSLTRDADVDMAALRIQQRMATVAPTLSDQSQIFVQRFDTSAIASFVMALSLRGSTDLEALRRDAEDSVVPLLQSVPGVVEVAIVGGASKQVAVIVDPERARARGTSAAEVRQALVEASRPVQSVGEAVDRARRLPVVLDGRARLVSDIADAPVRGARVQDVADLQLALASSVERYRIDGKTSVQITVRKDPQANLLRVAAGLRDAVSEFNAGRGVEGRQLHVDFDGSEILQENLDELFKRAATGAVLALLVLLVFLRDLRTVLVIGLAIPATLLIATVLFAAFGLTVNVLSLLGLAVSVGLLLDNSIVVLEAITRRRERGDPPVEAAERGAGLVQRAVLAGTVTTLVVFVPLFVIDTDFSPLFRELALSVTLPLAASLFVALTLLPMVAARAGARWKLDDAIRWPGRWGAPRPSWARSIYSALLRTSMRAPVVTCLVILGAVVAGLVFGLPLILVFADPPRESQQRIEIRAELPAGSPIEAADGVAEQLEALASALPQVEEVRASISEELVTVTAVFLKTAERTGPVLIEEEREALREKVVTIEKGASRPTIKVDPPPDPGEEASLGGGGGGFGLSGGVETVRIKGPPGRQLTDLARRARDVLEQIPGVMRVTWDVGTSRPTIEVRPDRERLAELGLPPSTVLAMLWTTRREGERLPHGMRLGDEEVELALHVEGADRRTVDDVRAFPMITPAGELVTLDTVASVKTGSEPPVARRHQRERTITLGYQFDSRARDSGEALEATRAAVDRALASLPRPPGHGIEVEHADTQGLDIMKQMVILGLLLVFAVLAMTFESATLPFLVLLAVPLAAVGVVGSLALTGTGVSEMVILALIVLLGLVVNQGILFIDRSEDLQRGGCRRHAAILRAAHERLRPILMTTASTAVGLLPLAIDKGGEQEIWPPFGRALLGGLITATLVSLIFIPAAALLFGRLRDTLRELGFAWTAVTTAACGAFLAWAYLVAELVRTLPLRILLAPFVWLVFIALARVVLGLARGERPPDLVTGRPLEVRVHNARKIYGGDPRPVREARRVQRWDAIARRLGLSESGLLPPGELRRRLTWQLGALGLLIWLAAQAQTTWGHLLLALPILVVLGALVGTAAGLAGRPGAWPLRGWPSRLLPAAVAGGTWTALWFARREGNPGDGATLVLAGILLGAWAIGHLVREGGFLRMALRALAPEPKVALDGVTLEFGPGLHGLLGPNGAGKSTLMRLVVNLYRPSRGTVSVNGHEVASHAASLQPVIGFLPQFFGVPPRLTARRYLDHQALLSGLVDPAGRARRVEEVLDQVGLSERADEAMGGFSGGMRQRVGIARTLLNAPKIVVVDEPTVGLDPRERIRFRHLLADLARDRVVLLSTHVVEDIGSSCKEVVVLDRGRVLFRGSPAELTARASGKAWILEVDEAELPGLQRGRRIVSTTRTPGGRIVARGVGEPPADAVQADPTLEDAYLLLLGRSTRELTDVA